MSEELSGEGGAGSRTEPVTCAECGTTLLEGQDREVTDDAVFCRPCFNNLTARIQHELARQGENINWPMAAVGAVAGGVLGAAVWWGFTVTTEIAFGLIAVVIGLAVGKGAVMASGNKRSTGLQGLSIVVSILSYGYGGYLVNRTFIHKAFASQTETADMVLALPLLPGPGLFYEVLRAGFEPFDLVFLAIVVYEAWKIPAPLRLRT